MESDRLTRPAHSLSFLVLGQRVRVECAHVRLRECIDANFGALAATDTPVPPDLHYRVEEGAQGALTLTRNGRDVSVTRDADDLVFLLERDVTVELQKLRSDLCFLHSAALERQGKACLLVAESGSGKSTTTWGLLHHGFRYLSDELCPIDLVSMQALPYPHALCLKHEPPPPYGLPAASIRLGRRIHIPTDALPAATRSEPCDLGAVFLVKHHGGLAAPDLRTLGRADASMHLYVNVLNALAHSRHGLDAVVRIAERAPCFAVDSADLAATCALIGSAFDRVVGHGPGAH